MLIELYWCSLVSDAELLNTSMPSPLSLTQTEEQDGGSEDEDRNELFAILQEASSDEEPDGDEDAADTQEDDADDLNVNVDIEDDTNELNGKSTFAKQQNQINQQNGNYVMVSLWSCSFEKQVVNLHINYISIVNFKWISMATLWKDL